MKFYEYIETLVFREDWKTLGLSDGELKDLQGYLNDNPEEGKIISGTGGLRKLHWSAKDKGKRGGARVLYVLFNRQAKIYLISAFGKSVKENISNTDKALFKELIKTLESCNNSKRGENE